VTEEEACGVIERLQRDLPPLNQGDPWEVMILGTPVASVDENLQPTGEYEVHVGWHCWALRDGDLREYGLPLSVDSITMEVEWLYRVLEHNFRDTMGTVTTLRSR
jgi:hypothetical protein